MTFGIRGEKEVNALRHSGKENSLSSGNTVYSSKLETLNPGDLVQISRMTRWGGTIPTNRRGIIIEKAYEAYEKHYSKWRVLVDGKVETILESKLRLVQDTR